MTTTLTADPAKANEATKTPEEAAAAAAAQTPEQKAAADAAAKAEADKVAAARAAETPEQKATREAAEKKTADEKAVADKAAKEKEEADKKANEVPEKYEDFKFPEGVTVDAAAVENFKTLAKELGLPQAKAQKLVDFQAAAVAKANADATEAFNKLNESYVAAAKADKEFGGTDFEKNVGIANAALKQFGDAELTKTLDETGLGNHPAMIRLLWKMGKAIAEDKIATGGSGAAPPKDTASKFYPNTPGMKG